MSFKIRDGITYVGKIDWESRTFHGEEFSALSGLTYNSYLIEDEKTVLIDTVWGPFAEEFIHDLASVVDLKKIDYVIANHAEVDHSGALPQLMKLIPDATIICSANGLKSLKGYYHQDWKFMPVKTGDKLSLGKKELVFVEARMLHWPDSLMEYLPGENMLFSNDAFGQHLASEAMYNDLVDQAILYREAEKYYANILAPLSKLVEAKINEVLAMNIPIDMICPSHGVIWRDNPTQIISQYMKWAQSYKENQITIVYDTMWNSTRRMAEQIARGISEADKSTYVKLYNSARSDKTEVITEIFKSKAAVFGSSTVYKGTLSSIAGLIEEIRGLQFKEKKAATFGSYGWSGEAPKVMADGLLNAGFEVIAEGLRVNWNPDDEALSACFEFGKMIADKTR
jgi:anaerobic nitric oxide reductase flavorubredoxin